MSTAQKPREAIREGAAEVKEKLRSDISSISKWTRVRRFVSLSPTMLCPDCEGAREIPCGACGGEGKQKLVWNDDVVTCEGCKGEGKQLCGSCLGRARVKNIHRKKFLWVLGIGGLGWAYLLIQFWGRDVLPEQSAKYLHGGGGGGTAQTVTAPKGPKGSLAPKSAGPSQPAGNAPGVPGPGGDQAAPPANNGPGMPNDNSVRSGQLRPRAGG